MEGDRGADIFGNKKQTISIHSLRMEGDCLVEQRLLDSLDFNPLPPHGGRPFCSAAYAADRPFQSTPSAWRETRSVFFASRNALHFNPLPPHGGRPTDAEPDVERDKFQSTPSAWRETISLYRVSPSRHISIHSLRMEGDALRSSRMPDRRYFNPLPPHGGRPIRSWIPMRRCHFNPLPPHGGRRL